MVNLKSFDDAGNSGKKNYEKQQALFVAMNYDQKTQNAATRIAAYKSEITVGVQELELRMLQMATQLLKREHSALLACFELAATENEVGHYIHP